MYYSKKKTSAYPPHGKKALDKKIQLCLRDSWSYQEFKVKGLKFYEPITKKMQSGYIESPSELIS